MQVMKPASFTVLILSLTATMASAIDFQFRYTFAEGDYWEGVIAGETSAGNRLMQNAIPKTAGYFSVLGEKLHGTDFSGGTTGSSLQLPIDGGVKGMQFDFSNPSLVPDEDTHFSLIGKGIYFQYWDKTGANALPALQTKVEFFNADRWSLAPQFDVADAGSTLLLLGLSALALRAGKKASDDTNG